MKIKNAFKKLHTHGPLFSENGQYSDEPALLSLLEQQKN